MQELGGWDTDYYIPHGEPAKREFPNATNISYEDQLEMDLSNPGACGNGNHCGQTEKNASKWMPQVLQELENYKK